jgi:hypothetical protein
MVGLGHHLARIGRRLTRIVTARGRCAVIHRDDFQLVAAGTAFRVDLVDGQHHAISDLDRAFGRASCERQIQGDPEELVVGARRTKRCSGGE